jgi:hypothetical protein
MAEVGTLIQIAVAILLFATLITYLLIKIPRKYRFKLMAIPATFALALYIAMTIPNLLGYAYPGKPKGDFTYISHSVKNNKVTLLAAGKDGKPRLYQFPDDPDTDAKLNQARALSQRGQKVEGKFKNLDPSGFPGLYYAPSPLEIHSPHNYGMLPPKDPTPQQGTQP